MPSSSQFKLPSLGLPSSSGGEFVLPNFANLSFSSGTSTGLADLAAAQLEPMTESNETTKSGFNIPNIFAPRPSLVQEPKSALIDLKSALVPESELKKLSKVPKVEIKQIVEVFIPKFIDCDKISTAARTNFTLEDNCKLLTLEEFRSRHKSIRIKRFSKVGRVIRHKLKRIAPQIKHGYEHKHFIQRFYFDTPSPDDQILAHLNKNKK